MWYTLFEQSGNFQGTPRSASAWMSVNLNVSSVFSDHIRSNRVILCFARYLLERMLQDTVSHALTDSP